MDTDNHTPTPWIIDPSNNHMACNAARTEGILCGNSASYYQDRANIARSVKCVNACEGIKDPEQAIADTLQLLKAWQRDTECPEDREELSRCICALGGDA